MVDENVLGLERSDDVVIELLKIVDRAQVGSRIRRLIVTAIEKSFAIFSERRAREFYPLQIIVQIFAGGAIADFPFLPIGARRRESIGHEFTIFADGAS